MLEITAVEPEITAPDSALPTPLDELRFAKASYSSRSAARDFPLDSCGFRSYKDDSDNRSGLRINSYVHSWLPTESSRPSSSDEQIPNSFFIGFIIRGAKWDEEKNAKANIEQTWEKLIGNGAAEDATAVVWDSLNSFRSHLSSLYPQTCKPRLCVHICGHSVGGYLAEAVTIQLDDYIQRENIAWVATTFDSPGLPTEMYNQALEAHPQSYWETRITGYLAAPNIVNTLHRHLGRIVHVAIPIPRTNTYTIRCIAADAARYIALFYAGAWVASAAGVSSTATVICESTAVRGLFTATEIATNYTAGNTRKIFNIPGAPQHLVKVQKLYSKVFDLEADELIDQHDISSFFVAFDRETGQLRPECEVHMQSWPCLEDEDIGSIVDYVKAKAAWMLPSSICPSNLGLSNMCNPRARIDNMLRGHMLQRNPDKEGSASAKGTWQRFAANFKAAATKIVCGARAQGAGAVDNVLSDAVKSSLPVVPQPDQRRANVVVPQPDEHSADVGWDPRSETSAAAEQTQSTSLPAALRPSWTAPRLRNGVSSAQNQYMRDLQARNVNAAARYMNGRKQQ